MLLVQFVFGFSIILAANPLPKYRKHYEISTGEKVDKDFHICNTKQNCDTGKPVSDHEYVIIDNNIEYNNESNIEGVKDIKIFSIDTNSDCKIKAIFFTGSTLIDKSILDLCPRLKYIYFDGEGYDCKYKPWRKFIFKAQQKNIRLDSNFSRREKACIDPLSVYDNYYFLDHIIGSDSLKYLKKVESCKCFTNCSEASVHCNDAFIKKSDLPLMLPNRRNGIRIKVSSNNITDPTEWFESFLKNQKFIKQISLDDNSLTAIPHLPETDNELFQIYLNNNNITKFDIEALKTYLFYKDLVVSLEGNPFICDCETSDFVEFMQTNRKLFGDINDLMCRHASTGELIRPWTFNYNECKEKISSWTLPKLNGLYYGIIFMSILDLIMIAIFCNVRLALNEVLAGNPNGRTPWIHYIWEFLKCKVV